MLSKRKIAMAIGITAITVFIIAVFFLAYMNLPKLDREITVAEELEFDIRKEIAILQSNRSDWNKYIISDYDWKVWKKMFEVAGAQFVKMDNWEEFKESLKQNPLQRELMLDEENRVIWHGFGIVAYLEY